MVPESHSRTDGTPLDGRIRACLLLILPPEILRHIIAYLTLQDKCQLLSTCRTFHYEKRFLFTPLISADKLDLRYQRYLPVNRLHISRPCRALQTSFIPLQRRTIERCFLNPFAGSTFVLTFQGQYGYTVYKYHDWNGHHVAAHMSNSLASHVQLKTQYDCHLLYYVPFE